MSLDRAIYNGNEVSIIGHPGHANALVQETARVLLSSDFDAETAIKIAQVNLTTGGRNMAVTSADAGAKVPNLADRVMQAVQGALRG